MRTILITGATSGIGRACALDFAKRLPDAQFLLLGRNQKALEQVASEIGATPHVCDLSIKKGQEAAQKLIEEKVPDLVINSAGLSYYGRAVTHTLEEEREMVEVNCLALQLLTLTAAKALQRAGKRGTILNISSAAAYLAYPGNATYAASKAFVSRFSEALDFELRGEGIRVLTFSPGRVATDFSHRASKGKALAVARSHVMPVEKVASAIWRQIERGKGVVIYNWGYRLALLLLPLAPKRWLGQYLEKRVELWVKPKTQVTRHPP